MFAACDGTPVDSPYPNISFQKKASIPGIGRSSAVGFAIDGKGYVALGRTGSRTGALNDCWQYDPVLDTWTQKATYHGKARVRAIAATVNGKAYVGLGFDLSLSLYNSAAFLKDFWCYDPQTNTWVQKADFPSIHTNACASFVFNNCIYAGFGFDGNGFSHELWKYNPDQNSWVKLNGFPGPQRVGGVFCTNGEHVYFGTGYNTFSQADWWEYFPATDSWKQLRRMPDNGRENAVSLSINNRFFVSTGRVFGGTLTGGHVDSDILEYDPVRNGWYKRGAIPNGNRENAVAFTINGKGYIGFGENDSTVLNDFWSFEP